MNKVPIAAIAMLLLPDKNRFNLPNLVSVAVGLLAGVVFVWTKSVECSRARAAALGAQHSRKPEGGV